MGRQVRRSFQALFAHQSKSEGASHQKPAQPVGEQLSAGHQRGALSFELGERTCPAPIWLGYFSKEYGESLGGLIFCSGPTSDESSACNASQTVLIASIGASREARSAGYQPNNMPTSIENSTAETTAQ